MAEEKGVDTITIKAPAEFKEALREAAFLRGDTISDAGLDILQSGFAAYQKRRKQKYQPVEKPLETASAR